MAEQCYTSAWKGWIKTHYLIFYTFGGAISTTRTFIIPIWKINVKNLIFVWAFLIFGCILTRGFLIARNFKIRDCNPRLPLLLCWIKILFWTKFSPFSSQKIYIFTKKTAKGLLKSLQKGTSTDDPGSGCQWLQLFTSCVIF